MKPTAPSLLALLLVTLLSAQAYYPTGNGTLSFNAYIDSSATSRGMTAGSVVVIDNATGAVVCSLFGTAGVNNADEQVSGWTEFNGTGSISPSPGGRPAAKNVFVSITGLSPSTDYSINVNHWPPRTEISVSLVDYSASPQPAESWWWVNYEGAWSAWSAWSPHWDAASHHTDEYADQTRSRSRPLYTKEVSSLGAERQVDTPRAPYTESEHQSQRLHGSRVRETWWWVNYESDWSGWSAWSPAWDAGSRYVDEFANQSRSRSRSLLMKEVSNLGSTRHADTPRAPYTETQTESQRLSGANKRPQAILFPNPTPVTEHSAVTLAAAASSNLAVSYTLAAGAASLAGSRLTTGSAGFLRVRADQPGNSIYAAAPPVMIDILVTPRISAIVRTLAPVEVSISNETAKGTGQLLIRP